MDKAKCLPIDYLKADLDSLYILCFLNKLPILFYPISLTTCTLQLFFLTYIYIKYTANYCIFLDMAVQSTCYVSMCHVYYADAC